MKLKAILLLPAFMLMLVACGGDTQPPPDIDATVEATVEEQLTATVTPTTEIVKETPKGKNCTLSGGEVVEDGWSGKDTGASFVINVFA